MKDNRKLNKREISEEEKKFKEALIRIHRYPGRILNDQGIYEYEWPISADRKYSPSEEAVNRLLEKQKQKQKQKQISKNERQAAWAVDKEKIEALGQELTDAKDKLKISKMNKKKAKKEQQEWTNWRKGKANAKAYYIRQKLLALIDQKINLFENLKKLSQWLAKKQNEEYCILKTAQQQERYTIAILYEDYHYPSYTKNRIKKDTLLHENTFKKMFLHKLHLRQSNELHSFLKKQSSERCLYFLWSLQALQYFTLEYKQLCHLKKKKNYVESSTKL